MIFADISDGASVFLDANTFVYHFAADPVYKTPCTQLLDRIEQKLVHGFTSTHVVTEIAHRLMTLKAIDAYGWPSTGIAARLRRRPSEVQKLCDISNSHSDPPCLQSGHLDHCTALGRQRDIVQPPVGIAQQ